MKSISSTSRILTPRVGSHSLDSRHIVCITCFSHSLATLLGFTNRECQVRAFPFWFWPWPRADGTDGFKICWCCATGDAVNLWVPSHVPFRVLRTHQSSMPFESGARYNSYWPKTGSKQNPFNISSSTWVRTGPQRATTDDIFFSQWEIHGNPLLRESVYGECFSYLGVPLSQIQVMAHQYPQPWCLDVRKSREIHRL
jgi:hypothetical protein